MNKKILSFLVTVVAVLVMTASFNVTASAKAKAKVKVSPSTVKITITKNQTGKVQYGKKTIKVSPVKGYKVKKVSYKVVNKNVATVSKKGVVTAKKAGTTKVNVTVKYKANKKKKVLTYKKAVKVVVSSVTKAPAAQSNLNVFNPNAKGEYSIEGLNLGNKAPAKSDMMKYLTKFDLGVTGVSSSDPVNSDVTGEVYVMGETDSITYYALYIKANKANAKIGDRDSLVDMANDAIKKATKDKIPFTVSTVAAIIFENKVIANDCSKMFEKFLHYSVRIDNVKLGYVGIYNIENLDVSEVEYFDGMFKDSFGTRSIVKMNAYLPETFSTAAARSFDSMFESFGVSEIGGVLTLPESFVTTHVTDMDDMFESADVETLNLPKSFVFDASKTYRADTMFYASTIKYINNKTPFNTKGLEDCICIPGGATYDSLKTFVDELSFDGIEYPGLLLYTVTDGKLINYVLNKLVNEGAHSIYSMHMVCTNIYCQDADIVLDCAKLSEVTKYSSAFSSAHAKSVTIKNATFEQADRLFDYACIKTIDISTCTFSSDCNVEKMFASWQEEAPTIYVKDAAMQTLIIDAFNADNKDNPISKDKVIIKK